MEDTLRGDKELKYIKESMIVLILVLMEDTLRAWVVAYSFELVDCLNPCFNGRYSQRTEHLLKVNAMLCLNPCFNGRYSQSQRLHCNEQRGEVLILVLMEDTLRAERWS